MAELTEAASLANEGNSTANSYRDTNDSVYSCADRLWVLFDALMVGYKTVK